jgi:hypothetical protein
MIIFESTLTTFEASFIFLRLLGQYQKLARSKNWTTIDRFSFAKSLKHTVSQPHFTLICIHDINPIVCCPVSGLFSAFLFVYLCLLCKLSLVFFVLFMFGLCTKKRFYANIQMLVIFTFWFMILRKTFIIIPKNLN